MTMWIIVIYLTVDLGAVHAERLEVDGDDLEHGGPLADHHRLLVRTLRLQRAKLVDQLQRSSITLVHGNIEFTCYST